MTTTKVFHFVSDCVVAAATLVILSYACAFAGMNAHVANSETMVLHTVAHSITTSAHTGDGIGVVREGRLSVDYRSAPAPLWNGLVEAPGTEYQDGWTDGQGIQSAPLGTVVDFPGGLYLATSDGWYGCEDHITFDGECSATGPVIPVVDSGALDEVPLMAEGGADMYFLPIVEDDPNPSEVQVALSDAGYSGILGDGRSGIYVPYGATVQTPTYGEVTIAHDGPHSEYED